MHADTLGSRTTFNFHGVLARLIFHEIKIGRFARADKASAMENSLNAIRCKLLVMETQGENFVLI